MGDCCKVRVLPVSSPRSRARASCQNLRRLISQFMRYFAFACDYDSTLADHGTVKDSTVDALRRLAASGRKLILVTGRELDDLRQVFPRHEIFHRIVAENGAILY